MKKSNEDKGRRGSRHLATAALVLGLSGMVMLPGSPEVQARAAAVPNCSDGYPRLGCKIWKVTVEAEVSIPPKASVTCETGGEWICARNLF